MALIRFDNQNLDRILDSAYEAYTDRLFDEAYGDHGERCRNCEYFVNAYKDIPCYCNRENLDEIEDDDEFLERVKENTVDPDDCCGNWEWDMMEDAPEEEW